MQIPCSQYKSEVLRTRDAPRAGINLDRVLDLLQGLGSTSRASRFFLLSTHREPGNQTCRAKGAQREMLILDGATEDYAENGVSMPFST